MHLCLRGQTYRAFILVKADIHIPCVFLIHYWLNIHILKSHLSVALAMHAPSVHNECSILTAIHASDSTRPQTARRRRNQMTSTTAIQVPNTSQHAHCSFCHSHLCMPSSQLFHFLLRSCSLSSRPPLAFTRIILRFMGVIATVVMQACTWAVHHCGARPLHCTGCCCGRRLPCTADIH